MYEQLTLFLHDVHFQPAHPLGRYPGTVPGGGGGRAHPDNKKPLAEYIGGAESCACHNAPAALHQLVSGEFSATDVERQEWTMPAGALHGAAGGPC